VKNAVALLASDMKRLKLSAAGLGKIVEDVDRVIIDHLVIRRMTAKLP
jgi:hypothetical protein